MTSKAFICLLLCLILPSMFMQVVAQTTCTPYNIGFESGTLNNWTCYAGNIDRFGVINLTKTAPLPNHHSVINSVGASVKDIYGGFPVLCPNGSGYSIKLGNEQTQAGAERVSYEFDVPANSNNYNLYFNYAVVLENPLHSPEQQPRFTANVFNVTDSSYVSCASFDFIPGTSLPGFLPVPQTRSNRPNVFYKDWSTASLSIPNSAGKHFRIEFTTNDCTVGGHFGYAYLDMLEGCIPPVTGNSYCTGQSSITVTAPGGFEKYTWYDIDNNVVGNEVGLTLSPPPPNNTIYKLTLIPYQGLGCPDTINTVIHKIDAPFNFVTKDTVFACPGSSTDLTAPFITQGSTGQFSLSYFADQYATTYLPDINNITKEGTYYIKAVSPEGCTNLKAVVIKFYDKIPLSIIAPASVTYPGKIDLSLTFKHITDINYSYYSDSLATQAVSRYIVTSGTYYIKAQNGLSCSTVSSVVVIINPPPIVNILATSAFTPNNDGINDRFALKFENFNEFGSLKVYNRYGILVYETTQETAFWDGMYNGQPLNSGVYYWIYRGRDAYYKTAIIKSGNVTIIR